jgi:hypothetical protein
MEDKMGNKIILTNLKEKLGAVRELVPGRSEDVYLITDFMESICDRDLYPEGLALKFAEVIFDISQSYNSINPDIALDEVIVRRKEFILNQVPYFLQVIDAIAEPKYATIFRNTCSDVLRVDAPRRIMVDSVNGYGENIVIATEWWATAIQAPRHGDSINPLIARPFAGKNKEKTEEEIMNFKYDLADGIVKELENNGSASLYVDISLNPL